MENYEDLKLLLNEVFKERHIDFSQYREQLIQRRVATRLRVTKCHSYPEYINFLKHHRPEMDTLLDTLTINVTQFYRDPRVFQAIAEKIIPRLFADEVIEKKEIVRIWSCGCSGGQEATTVLVLISEYLKQDINKPRILIYGTDIDKLSIKKANEGIYEEYEFKDLPAGLKEKYFLSLGNRRFERKKELNPFLYFREQDVVRSEPVKNVDLILCRNLFIYFKRELQVQCLEKFYRALNKGGFLVLGLTESLWGDSAKRFTEFDRDNRMYVKV
ncbi:MAG: protein-glutamate O-methyltransferase CheR [Verrucomicrobia bacterium]|nr:protein-glutamate O-methyltransferase CheR [Verrucomicrobiota bacterium]MBU1735587.1 protein-glutamate O-methyltransferase CheR [Verrucomicrobiota bacterium]